MNYTLRSLETGVESLSLQILNIDNLEDISNIFPKPSLADDPLLIFFYNLPDTDSQGFTHFERVLKFQEPISLYALLDYDPFFKAVKAVEPGPPISYQTLSEELEKHQDDVHGGEPVVQRLKDFLQLLIGHHRKYIAFASALTTMELYSKIVMRQYQVVQDEKFSALPVFQSLLYAIAFRDHAPTFNTVRANTNEAIFQFRQQYQQAGEDLEAVKKSFDLKIFNMKLNAAKEVHKIKAKFWAKQNRQTKNAAKIAFTQQLATVKAKNEHIRKCRVRKNFHMRNENLNNLHQPGDSARVRLQDHIIQAVVASQKKHIEIIMGDDSDDEEKNDSEWEDEENWNEDDEDADTLDGTPPDGTEIALLDGIVIPEGFENIEPTLALDGF